MQFDNYYGILDELSFSFSMPGQWFQKKRVAHDRPEINSILCLRKHNRIYQQKELMRGLIRRNYFFILSNDITWITFDHLVKHQPKTPIFIRKK